MDNDSDNYDYSDDEIDDKKHDKIVENVLSLNKVQQLKRPSRTEPTIHVSEFDLVKSVTGNKGSVHVNELSKVLKGRKKHVEIGKKLARTSGKATTLPKPLEKPQAEKIRRGVAYEKNRLEFDRWEAFVTANRAATHVSFPLNTGDSYKLEVKKAEKFPSRWRLKSDLQQKLEALEKVEEYHIEPTEKDGFPLTMEEMMEQRKEAAKLRAHQSYKEAKARRQNKIKSKKYHRIQRREKIKQQLKEFEVLQKTNPEEALKKLEDIERARAEERFSLRHKGTGQWAKNKQIRAKYDKESRQVLAQQLAISRDLTQKLKTSDDEQSEDEGIESGDNHKTGDPDNPWFNEHKLDDEMADFVQNYRKFWTEKNKELEAGVNGKTEDSEDETTTTTTEKEPEKAPDNLDEKTEEDLNETAKTAKTKKTIKSPKNKDSDKKKKKKSKKNKSLDVSSQSTSEWDVSVAEGDDLEEMFDKLEDQLELKVKQKLGQVGSLKTKAKNKKKKAKKQAKKVDLTIKSQSKKHVIDEALDENAGSGEEGGSNELDGLKKILQAAEETPKEKPVSDIDPNKFIKVKSTDLKTAIPDILTGEDDDEETQNNQRDIIMEAFEDDDVVDEFNKEKAEEVDKDKPKDIDLTLPGWGSWGGTGIAPSKRKNKRFIIKMPAKVPRRDDNKGSLIINEKGQEKAKEHMVAEVPFPFKTVKDFEASIRAPIGRTFVPETAFRRLTEPAVKTKLGAIIEPMTRDILIGVRKRV